MPARPLLYPALAATSLLLLSGCTTTTSATPPTHADHSWLVTADATAQELYINNAVTGENTDTLNGITLGTHAGSVQLGAGRIAFMDESKPQLDVLSIDSSGKASIDQHYAIPNNDGRWKRAGWLSTDTSRHYVAIGSDFDDSTDQRVTVVDLEKDTEQTADITTSEVTLAATGETGTEEVETFLVGDPLRLVVTAGGHLDAYSVSAIMRGDAHPTPVATTPLNAYPHGPIVNADGTVIGSDLATGVQTVGVTDTGFADSQFSSYPQASVESYRPRMAPDGATAVGAQAGATEKDAGWDTIPAYLTSASMTSGKLTSVNLGSGSFTRVAVTPQFAAVSLTSGSGDSLVLVKKGDDGAFNGEQTTVALDPLKNGPVVGQPAGKASVRFTAATDDGSSAFVTRGGEGQITQIDTSTANPVVLRTITVPSDLSDGGYLTTVDSEVKPYDLSGR